MNDSSSTRPAVILVRPREEGNVGAVARAMANMGLDRLILVEPAPEVGGVARGFGVGGWHILDGHSRCASLEEAVAPFRRVVGTTSLRQRTSESVAVHSPSRLLEVMAKDLPGTETALVFGPENNGLTRRQLARCHPVVAIPCAPEHPTLNLAQAVLILAYEIRQADPRAPQDKDRGGAISDPLAVRAELDAAFRQADEILHRVGYDQPQIRSRVLRELGQVAIRGDASSREVRILRRVLNRLQKALPPAAGLEAASGESQDGTGGGSRGGDRVRSF